MFQQYLGLQHKYKYSEDWLHHFKSWHSLQFHAVFGEKYSADKDAVSAYMDEFAKLDSDEHSTPESVYNADEIALFYTPNITLITRRGELPMILHRID